MTTEQARATSREGWTVDTYQVCGGTIAVERRGTGAPILVLPRDNGHPPQNEFLDLLAGSAAVHYPWLPGFHGGFPSEWDWLSNVRDLAVVLRQLVDAMGLARVTLAGLGFGGWLAAEMATMGTAAFDRLVLVGPMGIKPPEGFIYDQFLGSTETYARTGFGDPGRFEAIYTQEPGYAQLESWETDREMTSRIAWKPYMYNPTLPRLLAGVDIPTLAVWGGEDRIVPPSCGALYRAALPNCTLEVLEACGHAVDLEQPAALAARVAAFRQ